MQRTMEQYAVEARNDDRKLAGQYVIGMISLYVWVLYEYVMVLRGESTLIGQIGALLMGIALISLLLEDRQGWRKRRLKKMDI